MLMKTLAPSNASWRSFAVGLLALFFVLTHFALHFHCRGSVALTCRSVAIIGAIGLLGLLLGRQEQVMTVPSRAQYFDWSMHYFRAFAIVCIVVLHCMHGFGYLRYAEAFLSGSSMFFLFISGYLCQYLDMRRKTVTCEYYLKKLRNVILPYIAWSSITVAIVCLFPCERFGVVPLNFIGWFYVPDILLFGRAQLQYWYIPFVSVLFAVSPFLLRLSTERLCILTLSLMSVAIVFPRRGYFFSLSWPEIFYLFSFFTWSYVLGFLYCRIKDRVDSLIRRWLFIPFFFGVAVGVWLLRPETLGLTVAHIDLARSFQKFCFVLTALGVLSFLKDRRIKILDLIARYSFSLFFVHVVFIQDYVDLCAWTCRIFAFGDTLGHLAVIAAMLVYLADIFLLVLCLKRVSGRYSRMFIGS